MSMLRWTSVILVAGMLAMAGCGDDDDGGNGGGGGGGGELGGEAAKLEPPKQPAPEDCAAAPKSDQEPADLVPEPGRYTYTVEGTREEKGSGTPTKLPSEAPLIVTPSVNVGKVACFRTQFVYSPKEADTVTFAVSGEDVYITGIQSFVAGQTPGFKPEPPIKAIQGTGTEDWGGEFGGPTTGQYQGSFLARKPLEFEGKSERALGFELRFSFAGEVRGTSTQSTYVSPTKGYLFEQDVEQDRDFGGQSVVLKYKAKLKSFQP